MFGFLYMCGFLEYSLSGNKLTEKMLMCSVLFFPHGIVGSNEEVGVVSFECL